MANAWIISHPRHDRFANNIQHHLNQGGHSVHATIMDIVGNQNSNHQHLQSIDVALFLFSPQAINMPSFINHLKLAKKSGLRSLHIVVEPLQQPTTWLRDKHIDATQNPERAIKQIMRFVGDSSVVLPAHPLSASGHRVFISADDSDVEDAKQLAKLLRRTGIKLAVTTSSTDDAPEPDLNYKKRLSASTVFIPLVSPSASQSSPLQGQVAHALQTKTFIIPVLVKPLEQGIQLPEDRYVDATGDLSRAVQQITSILLANPPWLTVTDAAVKTQSSSIFARRNQFLRIASVAMFVMFALIFMMLKLNQEGNYSGGVLPTEITAEVAIINDVTSTETATLESTNISISPTSPRRAPLDFSAIDAEATEDANNDEESEYIYADFSADPLEGNAPLIVSFENYSEGDIVEYQWDFDGDGEIDSDEESPDAFVFEEAGEFEISLRIFDADGEEDVYYEYVYVYEGDGSGESSELDNLTSGDEFTNVEFILSPAVGEAPLTVSFTNLSEGDLTSYEWDFNGDGVIDSTSPNPPAYTYNSAGDFRPRLIGHTSEGEAFAHRAVVSVDAPEEPYAYFDVSPDFGEAPLTVTFINESEGVISEYRWDFNGDGVIDSTSPNPPAYTYTDAGEFEPRLTVIGPGGISQPEIMYVTVDPPEEPYALFSMLPSSGESPLTVTFVNHSEGTITDYRWDFDNDGVIDSTVANPPPQVFDIVGEYEVSLVVEGPGGISEPEINYVMVNAPPEPVASFTTNVTSGYAPLEVTFTDTSTGNITEYHWDFDGDGVVDSTLANPPPFEYTDADEYFAELIVIGLGGESIPYEVLITVNEVESPLASFSVDVDEGYAPLTVTFTDESEGDIESYSWDFDGDGIEDSDSSSPPAFTYTEAGEYDASLTLTGINGEIDSYDITIVVHAVEITPEVTPEITPEITETATPPPVANFTVNVSSGTAPLTVTFTDASTGIITDYAWDFNGDGLVDSTDSNPLPYIYTSAGVYQASLIVTGEGGASAPYALTITVLAVEITPEVTPDPTPEATATATPPPVANFTPNVITGTAPLIVNFTDASTGNITDYAWDFNGDGLVDSTLAIPPAFTYAVAGTYQASLIVTGAGGASTPYVVTITVSEPPPVANFTPSVITGLAPLIVNFTDASTGNITDYAWDFNGDGLVDSTLATPAAFTYTLAGTYQASLIVTGAGGASTPYVVTITVSEPPPVAFFETDVITGIAPLTVTFTDLSSGAITDYAWDFDGDLVIDSILANPLAWTYTVAGTYSATLTVSGTGGISTPYIVTITVTP